MNKITENMCPSVGIAYRILVVDDEPGQRTLQREILAAPRYLVAEARNGAEAFAILAKQSFDVVLLDRCLPDMDGIEVCRRIRATQSECVLPIILVTGTHAGPRGVAEGFGAGASDYLQKPYHPMELTARVDAAVARKRLSDQLDNTESLLFTLARMVEAKDTHTGDHCTRLSHLAVVFGQKLGLDFEDLHALRRGGVLHDIGKLGVPDRIMLKNGPLTEDEWGLMRNHTVIGERLCAGLKSMCRTLPIIRSHHERWDGSGYPDGLRHMETPLLGRVFQIVDMYDALTHERSYKGPFSKDRVIQIFHDETARGWRDPELVGEFLNLLDQAPESLDVTEAVATDLGAQLFDALASGGYIDWAHPTKTQAQNA